MKDDSLWIWAGFIAVAIVLLFVFSREIFDDSIDHTKYRFVINDGGDYPVR